jgi:ABC-type lipoprotein export system ATPase subunit
LQDVYKAIDSEVVLRGVDLQISSGVLVAVRGRSGVGKTTLARVAALLLKPDKGSVAFMGLNTRKLGDAETSALRLRYIGYVDQECTLIEELTAWENAELPLKLLGVDERIREEALSEVFEALGLRKLEYRKPRELSGGQRQRVVLARALVKKPRLLVADEPFAHLDDQTTRMVFEHVRALAEENGMSVLITTTDLYTRMDVDEDYILENGTLRREAWDSQRKRAGF